jgi:hypothetical protein
VNQAILEVVHMGFEQLNQLWLGFVVRLWWLRGMVVEVKIESGLLSSTLQGGISFLSSIWIL